MFLNHYFTLLDRGFCDSSVFWRGEFAPSLSMISLIVLLKTGNIFVIKTLKIHTMRALQSLFLLTPAFFDQNS